ncbi:MAG: Ribonuclease [Bacteroidota bacterium]
MKLTILGCYAATPRSFTNPTSQVLEIKNRMFLIDCGEGTQVELRRNKIKFSSINHIFISHLHGDHCYGLIGLISTFMLLGRTTDLHIYGPTGIKEMILLQIKLGGGFTAYKLFFHELSSKQSENIFEDDKVLVKTIPLKHRIYTNGFLFQEKLGDRKLDINAVQNLEIDKCYYQKIKSGGDIKLDNGTVIPNALLSTDSPLPKSYAFCSDTAYNEDIIPIIKNVDVLYHEATFLESEAEKAPRTMHSTAKEAAQIAKISNVKKLILGHFSTRYDDIQKFKTEAQTIFENVELANDGKVFEL